MRVLEVVDVHKEFGGIKALNGVSFEVNKGEVFFLVGANGAGKSTLLNVITNFYSPSKGFVKINGVKTSGLPPYDKRLRGIRRSFQIPQLLLKITVLENLLVPCFAKENLDEKQAYELAIETLKEFNLENIAYKKANTLSGGQAKLVDTLRALIGDPLLVVLDEPFAGVSPALTQKLLLKIKQKSSSGTTFLIVTHVFSSVLQIADKIGVMDQGRLIAQGEPEKVLKEKNVIEAFMGVIHESTN